jgi:hypothetical protein
LIRSSSPAENPTKKSSQAYEGNCMGRNQQRLSKFHDDEDDDDQTKAVCVKTQKRSHPRETV